MIAFVVYLVYTTVAMEFRLIDPTKLRKQREQKGYSIRKVAELSGNAFTFGAYGLWELGSRYPNNNNIPKLLEVLGCKFEDISVPASKAANINNG
jgi:transcriptional regulator with XRE-family HTH domain